MTRVYVIHYLHENFNIDQINDYLFIDPQKVYIAVATLTLNTYAIC